MRDPRRAAEVIRDLIGDRQLIVVSNREPYVHRQRREGIRVERPAGGLTSALDPVMQAVSGTWIAWGSGDADFSVTDARGTVRVPPEEPRYTLKRVALSQDDVDGYYYGYANQALWPLFHFVTEQTRFRRGFWTAYQRVNRKFADAVLEEMARDAVVWVHDYHLMLVPRILREMRPELFLMHFWHIPWPTYDIWQTCPQGAELLDGVLANDLIGFQRPRHVQEFLDCVQRQLGAEVDAEAGTITYEQHVAHVQAFPISVDFAALDQTARSRGAARWMARLRRRYGLEGRTVAIGVDRLDYTKGIPERLRALDAVLTRTPQIRERLVFIQKSAPSRTRIAAYRRLAGEVEHEINRLNSAHGTSEWQPVVYITQPLSPEAVAALYRLADVCVVSSLQDGMNLVAKEFVACQVDKRGVLVLSELAGAQRELTDSITINPRDTDGFAAALQQAIEMPGDERRARMARMRAYLVEHDIYHWLEEQFRAAERVLQQRPAVRWLREHVEEIERCIRERGRLAVLCDLDGTLAPIAAAPDAVQLPAPVAASLTRLAAASDVIVAILSGRSLQDLRSHVGIDGIIYSGNHGLEIAGAGWTWVNDDAQRSAPAVARIAKNLRRRLRGIRGAVIQEKGLSASVHYRMVAPSQQDTVRQAVEDEVRSAHDAGLRLTAGKRVLEIRPVVPWDKGAAARRILERTWGAKWAVTACAIFAGDDSTDEDAFRALDADAVTVKVGASTVPTAARFVARDVDEIAALLSRLAEIVWRRDGDPGPDPANR